MGDDVRKAYTRSEYQQIRSIISSGQARLPICFCIDLSESMGFVINRWNELIENGDAKDTDGYTGLKGVDIKPELKDKCKLRKRDGELRDVLGNMIEGLKNEPSLKDSAIIDIVSFSEFADLRIGPDNSEAIQRWDIDQLKAQEGNETNAGTGIRLALEKLDFITKTIKDAGVTCYTPFFIFMSDGKPTDAREAERQRRILRQRFQEKELNVIPIAIGEGCEDDWMRSFTEEDKVYHMDYPEDYEAVFDQLTKAVKVAVAALPNDAHLSAQNAEDQTNMDEEDDEVESTEYGAARNDADIAAEFKQAFGNYL